VVGGLFVPFFRVALAGEVVLQDQRRQCPHSCVQETRNDTKLQLERCMGKLASSHQNPSACHEHVQDKSDEANAVPDIPQQCVLDVRVCLNWAGLNAALNVVGSNRVDEGVRALDFGHLGSLARYKARDLCHTAIVVGVSAGRFRVQCRRVQICWEMHARCVSSIGPPRRRAGGPLAKNPCNLFKGK
jgi:hypothetical protein